MENPRTATQINNDIAAQINAHDIWADASEPRSNAHAYHYGQAAKYMRAQRLIKDILEAEQRFEELAEQPLPQTENPKTQ